MEIETFVTLGLGDNSFLVGSGDEAVLVDPQRDAWRFLSEAARRGWRIRNVIETHVHNDYLSGALELRQATGAEILVPGRGGPYGFDHRPVDSGDELHVGDTRFAARAAPGHTFEHLNWEVGAAGAAQPQAVFTGGSLLVGSVGRSDLLGEDRFEELARLQFRTLAQLAALPDDVRVLPTHGAGSFCVATAPTAERTSTLGIERISNPVLQELDEDTFVRQQLASLGRYPAYYPRMAPINRVGPRLLGQPPQLSALTPGELESLVNAGAWVIDGRDRMAFAAGHVRGSLNIELNEGFGSYVGWLVPFGARLVLIMPDPVTDSIPEAVLQLLRIGYDDVAGVLAGGIEAWSTSGRPVRSYPTAAMRDLFGRFQAHERTHILDVRQPAEWRDEGTLPDSQQIFVADIPARLGEIPRDREVWVVCTTGHRSAIAASLLDAVGVDVRLVARGGTIGWVERFAPESVTAG